jgi:Mycoplasma protein of unknown function, DUF285
MSVHLTAFFTLQSHFDTSRVTDMNHVFKEANNFTGRGLEMWDTSRVTIMWNMFQLASNFNGNIGGWSTGRVTNMVRERSAASIVSLIIADNILSSPIQKTMFNTASKFNQDLR